MITAGIVYLALQETRPASREGEPEQTMAQTFGYILSLNAAMVVLFQFPITRWISKYRPVIVMAVGTLLYAVGFGMYGLVSTYVLFLVAMVIITVGEMLVSPVGQAIVARLAPEDMRGRYMAVFGFSWVIPSAVGPLLAGLVMDNADQRWVWYGAGVIGLIAAGAFVLLERWVGRATWAAIDERLNIIQMLEERKISADEAANSAARYSQFSVQTGNRSHDLVKSPASRRIVGDVTHRLAQSIKLGDNHIHGDQARQL